MKTLNSNKNNVYNLPVSMMKNFDDHGAINKYQNSRDL